MAEEKKERTPWQKVVRGFWITLACIGALVVFFVISMIPTEDDDRSDILDNQLYVVTVSHEVTNYTYFCSGYKKNMINGSFILIDYEGVATHELFITSSTYFRIEKNLNYKEEYFEKEEETEKTTYKKTV